MSVRGLDGAAFVDASGKEIVEGVQQGDVLLSSDKDHVYTMDAAPKHEFALMDPGLRRAIAIVSGGNGKLVVWNPGTAYVVDDHRAEDWRKFVCVEPVSDWPGGRTLQPGESYGLVAAIQASLDA